MSRHWGVHRGRALYPHEQTFSEATYMSAKCQKRRFVPQCCQLLRLCSPGTSDICAFCLDLFALKKRSFVALSHSPRVSQALGVCCTPLNAGKSQGLRSKLLNSFGVNKPRQCFLLLVIIKMPYVGVDKVLYHQWQDREEGAIRHCGNLRDMRQMILYKRKMSQHRRKVAPTWKRLGVDH